MTDNFLLGFSKLKKSNSVTNSSSPYSNTLPTSDCINGYPINKYEGYGVNAWEVLYSIWVANQSTIGATFTTNQYLTAAPTSSPTKGPENIFILRHAEDSAPQPNYSLDNNGFYRASQLIGFINKLASDGYPISYIITCNPCAYNTPNPSMRPEQTIALTSCMLNIPMFIYGDMSDYKAVVSKLFLSGIFDGLNVLICWERTSIQGLALRILDGASSLEPSRLPATIRNGTEFFVKVNPCPDGNYLCNDTSSPYYAGEDTDSKYYPYWQHYDYNSMYWLSSSPATNYVFDFKILPQPCLTCYASCDLHIGLYQTESIACALDNVYYSSSDDIEAECQVPSNWAA